MVKAVLLVLVGLALVVGMVLIMRAAVSYDVSRDRWMNQCVVDNRELPDPRAYCHAQYQVNNRSER